MITPGDRFELLVNIVYELVRERNFRRRRQSFVRSLPELWHVIRLARSRWNTADECDFWIEFGVYVPGVFSLIRPELKEPLCPDATNLTISWTSGWQYPPFLARSWKLTSRDVLPETDVGIQSAVKKELIEYTLPFLEQFEHRRDVIRFLEWLRVHRMEVPGAVHIAPDDHWIPVYLAVLYWQEGDRAASLRELHTALSDENAGIVFREMIQALQSRLLSEHR